MSAFRYEKLPPWTLMSEAGPISAAPEYDPNVMATYCHEDGDGDVIYGPDIPLVVRRAVPFRFGDSRFYAIVAEPKDPEQSASLAGKELVMTTSPLSRGWYDHGKFQFGSKYKPRNPGRKIQETLRQNPRILRDLAQEWRENPFDSRDWVATAMLFDPYPLDPLEKYILGRQAYVRQSPDQNKQQPKQLMAICDNYQALRDKLLVDELLLDIVNATCETRRLFLRYYRSRLHQMDLSKITGSGNGKKEPPSYLVFEEIADSNLATEVMATSVDLALAGPEELTDFRQGHDAQGEPRGKQLAKHRARDIYLQIYWNLWKRTVRRRASSVRPSRGRQKASIKDPQKQFWLAVKRAVSHLDLSPQQIALTCDRLIEDFISDRDMPAQLIGPYHEKDHPLTGETDDEAGVIRQFVLDAAALLGAGHGPVSLCQILDEIHRHEAKTVQKIVGWIKEKHAAFWTGECGNSD